MKKVIFLSMIVISLVSCKDESTTATTDTKDSTAATDYSNYPYTIKNPDTWETGDRQNTLMVLKSLKGYETGNIEEAVAPFADSVTLRFDEMDTKVAKDSLKALFTKWRSMNKSVKITMHDWESVKSKAKNEEYVSLWYTQAWEDNNGKSDSLSVMDDLKILNGKIVELDEKTRKFPKKKA